MRTRSIHVLLLFCLSAALLHGQRFFPDDPLEVTPKPRPVKDLKNRKLSDYYDLFSNQFATLGEPQPEVGPKIRAQGVSTLGEPMEGPWWEKRHYYRRMSIEELKQGPGRGTVPDMSKKWTVVSAKNEGITPGFVIIDGNKRRFFIKFDPITNPEMATSADAIVSRLFYAMGYHVPENHVVYFSPDQLEIGGDVEISDKLGRPRKMTDRDVTEILLKVPKTEDGKYRATASLALPGKPIGPPRYYGTRTDDPNDIVPHEHRRDLRGLHVIDAWVNHDDSRAINNLDIVTEEGGIPHVKHYQLDFGSTLGSGTQQPNSPRSGAYFFTWKESAKQLFTLGAVPPYWAFADYPDYPSLGRFEWKVFDPEKWVPEYPNAAFRNRLPDDEFWGAKLVTAFTDEEIKAIVSTGQLTNKAAEEWLVECLIQRRNKIGKAYFPKVLPLDKFTIDGGEVKWEDIGAKLGYTQAAQVDLAWSRFDNNTGSKSPLGVTGPRLPNTTDGYSLLTLKSRAKPAQTIDVYVRHQGGNARIVGIERNW
jgi:hypothetical protein